MEDNVKLLSLKERVFKNNVIRKIFGANREEIRSQGVVCGLEGVWFADDYTSRKHEK